MGLDMWLIGRRTMWAMEGELKQKAEESLSWFLPVEDVEIETIDIVIGEWRKVNHIHRWFLYEAQVEWHCPITSSWLTKLKDLCSKVLEKPFLAPQLLPTFELPFGGSLKYDDRYFDETRRTIEIIDKALKAISEGWEIYYKYCS